MHSTAQPARAHSARFLLALTTLAGCALAQDLVRDIRQLPATAASSAVTRFHVLGSLALFAADGNFGIEPYVTDGTPNGTQLLADLVPGGDSSPAEFAAVPGAVVFRATTPETGTELWRTDGTAAGTTLVVDLWPGPFSGVSGEIVSFGGYAYFQGWASATGYDLWRTDGTAAGTTLFANIAPGPAPSFSSISNLKVLGSWLYFSATDGLSGVELWRTDGTTTNLVADIYPGAPGSFPRNLTQFGAGLLFDADAGSGSEPFFSNGTAVGTVALGDLLVGGASSNPAQFVDLGGIAVFLATGTGIGREVWRTDGTAAGTYLVADVQPGAGSGAVSELALLGAGRAVFAGDDGSNGSELWITDGTLAGTTMVANLHTTGSSSPSQFAKVGNEVWFRAFAFNIGTEIWRTDGTTLGTSVFDFAPGSGSTNPWFLTPFGNGVLCSGRVGTSGDEPMFTDCTLAGTALLADLATSNAASMPRSFVDYQGRVAFAALDTVGTEPWITDGTTAGTSRMFTYTGAPSGSNPTQMVAAGNSLFFVSADGNLFVTDATAVGTVQLTTASLSAPSNLVELDGAVLFGGQSGAGRELWRSDGTTTGTVVLADIFPGAGSGVVTTTDFARMGDAVYFSATDGFSGVELWRSDGTTFGTQRVVDLNPGLAAANPRHLTPLGDQLYFVASEPMSGEELWRTDGTATGTTLVWDGVVGAGSSTIENPTVAGGKLFFTALIAGARQIWVTDGTSGGTVQLTSTLLPTYTDLTATAIGLFFVHDDRTGFGRELWLTDGTVPGTRRVLDLAAGPFDGVIAGTLQPAFGGTQLVFGGHDTRRGTQLWISDGTATGTRRLTAFGGPGRGAVALGEVFTTEARVFFAADDGSTGMESWVFDVATSNTAFHLVYGTACSGTAGLAGIGTAGLPQLGNATFAVTLARALPNTFAFEVYGFTRTALPVGPCTLLVGSPTVGTVVVTDAAGTASATHAIPNQPALLGSDLFLQWGIVDPLGPALGFLALSDGLQLHLGR